MDVLKPDPRNLSWVVVNLATGTGKPLELADFHAFLEEIQLTSTTPEHIQNSFLTARHLELYSWFVYRFTMVAQLQAYATLEYALRERLGHAEVERRPGLRQLLSSAVERGFVEEQKIRDWPGHREDIPEAERFCPGEWLRRLPEFIARFRNDLAHGSFTLMPDGGRALRVVGDIINQLYPETHQNAR